jgi:hypothetical protein
VTLQKGFGKPLNSVTILADSVLAFDGKSLRVFAVNLDLSNDKASIECPSGGWDQGMSGGPLVRDGKPVGVVSGSGGMFRLTKQMLTIYDLTGKLYGSQENHYFDL